MTMRTAFIPVAVKAAERSATNPALIISNLQSPLDTFLLSFVRRPFLLLVPERAKSAPVIGWMLRLAGVIFVPADRRGQMKALVASVDALKNGKSVAMFPEGVPKTDGVIRPFPSAVFSAARKAQVPVVPVTINGSYQLFDGGVMPKRRPSTSILITVHEEIKADPDDSKTALTTREIIRNVLPRELQGE